MTEASTLLLVHGAWSGGWIWEPILDPLRERGVRFEVIEQLPSAGTDAAELGDLDADAEHVRARLDDAAGPVVLCGHSYGGMVITEVADHPAISHSIYLAAFWPPKGQSLLDLFGAETLPEWIVAREDGSLSLVDDTELVRQALFADLDPDRAAQAHDQLVLQSASSFESKSSAPPRSHPVTYLVCAEDQAVPVPAQEAMATAADRALRIQSAHCPQLSHLDGLADALASVVGGSQAATHAT
jgi:pimeloyl-ACP methyl ester carboxylesterase